MEVFLLISSAPALFPVLLVLNERNKKKLLL